MSDDLAPARGIVCGLILGAVIWAIILAAAHCHASPLQQVTVTHIVAQGETLEDIGRFYADPVIDDPRYVAEFVEGIFEYNYHTVFEPRGGSREVRPGDTLRVVFWAKVSTD
ncbi:MAG TPA: hypothetical protein VN631_16195 [Negativicutes bacterium]|nr:hypothetical protein [Negativicutes bacterium]